MKKQARTTAKMADHGNKCFVPGWAENVKCRDGLVSVFRKVRKANNTVAVLAVSFQYIRFH